MKPFAAAVLAALCLVVVSTAPAASPVLVGKVGFHDRYLITLTFANGKKVRTLKAGTYALVVHDWSTLNYHRHTSKADQVLFSQGSDRGYELASALLVDAANGDPLAPQHDELGFSPGW